MWPCVTMEHLASKSGLTQTFCVFFLILHFKNFIYLFSGHALWCVGSYFFLLQWKHRVLTTRLPGKSNSFEIKFLNGVFGKMSSLEVLSS